MDLIFDWCKPNDSSSQWRRDEHIVSLRIFHKEFSFASAEIALIAPKNGIGKIAKIGLVDGDKIHLLFKGRVVSFPLSFGGNVVKLEMIAEPKNYQRQLVDFVNNLPEQNLHDSVHDSIIVDDLFYSEEDMKNPTVFLEGANDVFFWNAHDENLHISNIYNGGKNVKITGAQILKDTIKVRLAREPYDEIDVSVTAKWTKHHDVMLDLFPIISQKFSYNILNSFTDIKANLQRTGECVFCDIHEINPNTAECLTKYPLKSPEFLDKNNRKCSFKRFYYDGELVFHQNYEQKITEIAHLKIKKNGAKSDRVKRLNFTLNNIQLPQKYPHWDKYTHYENGDNILYSGHIWKCTKTHDSSENFSSEHWSKEEKIPDALQDDSVDSFFATNRGRNCIKYAAQKALALLNYSQRFVEIDFCVPMRDFWTISLDDRISLEDINNYDKKIEGKVIKIQIIATSEQRIMKITIGCGAYDKSVFDVLKSWTPEINVEKSTMKLEDIVRSVEIFNTPEEQIAALSDSKQHSQNELKQILRSMTTKIKVLLKSPKNATPTQTDINVPDITIG